MLACLRVTLVQTKYVVYIMFVYFYENSGKSAENVTYIKNLGNTFIQIYGILCMVDFCDM